MIPVAVKSMRIFYLASLLSAKNQGYIRPYSKTPLDIEDKFFLSSRFNDPIIEKYGIYPNAITKPTIGKQPFCNTPVG